jgi:NSS family neurotransmitter:Na+ symporter
MKKDVCLEASVRQIEVFDTGIAFLAGLMVIPAVFAFSAGDPEALGKGPGLMFVTLPKVFDTITGGRFIGILFFLLVLFAALTSSISLMETIVSIFTDKFKIKRRTACLAVIAICLLLGIPSSLGNGLWNGIRILNMDFLTFFDFASNNLLMPIVAFITCIFVTFCIKRKAIIEEVELSGKFKWKKIFSVIICYVAPICILTILVSSVLSAFGVINI